jgi:hypothetical protein
MNTIRRQGTYWRVADPQWHEPFDGAWSMRRGGRWNAVRSFPVTYLNADMPTAQANAERHLRSIADLGIEIEDFDDSELPVAVPCVIRECEALDVVTDAGCLAAGLPVTYPNDGAGRPLAHSTCQPIGQRAYDEGMAGIAYRSAAATAPSAGEELAWFGRPGARLEASGDPVHLAFG